MNRFGIKIEMTVRDARMLSAALKYAELHYAQMSPRQCDALVAFEAVLDRQIAGLGVLDPEKVKP